jgi:hypothetical protein
MAAYNSYLRVYSLAVITGNNFNRKLGRYLGSIQLGLN